MKAEIDMSEVARKITVKVKVKGRWRMSARLRLGMALVRFGVWISGLDLDYLGLEKGDDS